MIDDIKEAVYKMYIGANPEVRTAPKYKEVHKKVINYINELEEKIDSYDNIINFINQPISQDIDEALEKIGRKLHAIEKLRESKKIFVDDRLIGEGYITCKELDNILRSDDSEFNS